MNSEKILSYAVWLGIAALVAMQFRAASCEETKASYKTKIATCECLEPDRVSVTVEAKDPKPAP